MNAILPDPEDVAAVNPTTQNSVTANNRFEDRLMIMATLLMRPTNIWRRKHRGGCRRLHPGKDVFVLRIFGVGRGTYAFGGNMSCSKAHATTWTRELTPSLLRMC